MGKSRSPAEKANPNEMLKVTSDTDVLPNIENKDVRFKLSLITSKHIFMKDQIKFTPQLHKIPRKQNHMRQA